MKLTVKPGSFLIVDTSHARGGVRIIRTRGAVTCPRCGYHFAVASTTKGLGHTNQACPSCGSQAEEADTSSRKKVDHKVFVKDGNNITQSSVRCVLRQHCTPTSMGWICPRENLAAVREAYARIAREAVEFNERAARAGSAIRVEVGFVPVELAVDNADAAAALAGSIRETCADLHAALAAGNRPVLAGLARKAKNLPDLAVDTIQRSVIEFALENFKEARGALNAAAKESGLRDESRHDDRCKCGGADCGQGSDGSPRGDLAKRLAQVGPTLDLEALEACIDHFDPGASIFDDGEEA